MKKYLILILILIDFISCTEKKENNIDIIKHVKKFYDSGELLCEGFKKNDSLYVGVWTVYNKAGSIKSIQTYNMNGHNEGANVYFYPNGLISNYSTMKNGENNGLEYNFTSKGEVINICYFTDGKTDSCDYYNHNLCNDDAIRYSDPVTKKKGLYKCKDGRWEFERELTKKESDNGLISEIVR